MRIRLGREYVWAIDFSEKFSPLVYAVKVRRCSGGEEVTRAPFPGGFSQKARGGIKGSVQPNLTNGLKCWTNGVVSLFLF